MMIWGTIVTGLQFFGYSIALGGLVYYKLGAEQLKGYFAEGGRQWADFGARRPVLRKLIILATVVMIVFVLLGGLAPTYAADYVPKNYLDAAKNAVGST